MTTKFDTQTKVPDMNRRGNYQQTMPVDGDFLSFDHDQQPPSYEEAASASSNPHHPSATTASDHSSYHPSSPSMTGDDTSNVSGACRSRCGASRTRSQDALAQGYQSQTPMSAYEDENAKWESKLGEPGCCFSESGACCFSSRGGCCFSDRGGCCFSDREGCCFSDRQGCCFSDEGGCCCNKNGRG